jgi:hypothetical protein
MGMLAKTADRVRKMVRATRTPWLDEARIEDEDSLTAVLVDIDLTVLGADPLTFAIRQRDVNAERGILTQLALHFFRAPSARRLLSREHIFRTPFIRNRYEKQTRENLARFVFDLRMDNPLGVGIGATDRHVFTTRFGALETLFTWDRLVSVTSVTPDRMGTMLVLDFGCSTDVPSVMLDDPHARDVVERLRVIPGYRRDLERSSQNELVFSSPISGRPKPPLVPLRGEYVYR